MQRLDRVGVRCRDVRTKRRGERRDVIVVAGHDDRGIGDQLLELGLDRIGVLAGEDAAIDHRGRKLRQRVVRMAAEQPRRDAARARQADLALACFDEVGRFAVVRIGKPAAHRVAERAFVHLRLGGEIGAGRLVELGREAIGFQLVERMGEAVDRIVLARLGRMPAAVAHGEGVAGEGLFSGLHREAGRAAVRIETAAAAIGIEAELGMAEQIEPLARALLRADAVGFFVAGEQHDDVALRLEPGGLQIDHRLRDAR